MSRARAHGVPHGMLCVGCFEKRLGRELCARDFADVGINDPYHRSNRQSARLLSRLTRGER